MRSHAIRFFVGLVALGTSMAYGADKDVEALLANMRKAYSSISTATMKTDVNVNQGGVPSTIKISLSYSKPNKINAMLSGVGLDDLNMVCDGKNVAVLQDKKKLGSRAYSLDVLGQGLTANLETLCLFDWKRQLSTEKGDNMNKSKLKLVKNVKWLDKTWSVLEETAAEQNVFVRYYVDPKSFLIWRTIVQDLKSKDQQQDCIVQEMKLGVTLDSKLFDIPK